MENSTAHESNVEDISSLSHFLNPLRHILDDEEVTEICINKPHEAFVQHYSGWSNQKLDFASAN